LKSWARPWIPRSTRPLALRRHYRHCWWRRQPVLQCGGGLKEGHVEVRPLAPLLEHQKKSVVGMTTWVCQRQRDLPAGVPGISATIGQQGRLRSSLLATQAGNNDATPNQHFIKVCRNPTEAAEGGYRGDASFGPPPPTAPVKQPPMRGSEVSRGHIPRICRSRGQGYFIKRHAPGRGAGEAGPAPTSRPL
jgi:hypothetical protein